MSRLAAMLKEHVLAGMFLDRDGVVNVKAPPGEYITSPTDLVLLPGAAAAIHHVNKSNVPVYIVTNQRWVARHRDGIDQLRLIHQRICALLGAADAHVDGIYACVHEINCCSCRKPERGLVDQALRHNPKLSLSSCAMVGDAESDIELAARCGMHSVRIFGDPDDTPPSASATRAGEIAVDLHSAVVGGRQLCGVPSNPSRTHGVVARSSSAGER